jgi:hypothetical protein
MVVEIKKIKFFATSTLNVPNKPPASHLLSHQIRSINRKRKKINTGSSGKGFQVN